MTKSKNALGGGAGKSTETAGAAAADDAVSFEEALGRLEDVVRRLEQGDQPLEQALGLFEEGIKLSRVLTVKLEKAQARIDQLVATRGGGSKLEPFGGIPDGQ